MSCAKGSVVCATISPSAPASHAPMWNKNWSFSHWTHSLLTSFLEQCKNLCHLLWVGSSDLVQSHGGVPAMPILSMRLCSEQSRFALKTALLNARRACLASFAVGTGLSWS